MNSAINPSNMSLMIQCSSAILTSTIVHWYLINTFLCQFSFWILNDWTHYTIHVHQQKARMFVKKQNKNSTPKWRKFKIRAYGNGACIVVLWCLLCATCNTKIVSKEHDVLTNSNVNREVWYYHRSDIYSRYIPFSRYTRTSISLACASTHPWNSTVLAKFESHLPKYFRSFFFIVGCQFHPRCFGSMKNAYAKENTANIFLIYPHFTLLLPCFYAHM